MINGGLRTGQLQKRGRNSVAIALRQPQLVADNVQACVRDAQRQATAEL